MRLVFSGFRGIEYPLRAPLPLLAYLAYLSSDKITRKRSQHDSELKSRSKRILYDVMFSLCV